MACVFCGAALVGYQRRYCAEHAERGLMTDWPKEEPGWNSVRSG